MSEKINKTPADAQGDGPLLKVSGVDYKYGSFQALSNASFEVFDEDLFGQCML